MVFSGAAAAQIRLSNVAVRLVREARGGCVGPCVNYSVTIRVNGTIEYKGTGLVEGIRTQLRPTR